MKKRTSGAARAREIERDDVLAWAQEFLPDYFSDAPALFHAELMADLQAAEKRLIARVAPRGHAKSTCAALAYPLWCICHGARRNIVIVTHEGGLATQFVRDIRHELETNERILESYGELFGAGVPEGVDSDVSPPKNDKRSSSARDASNAAAREAEQAAKKTTKKIAKSRAKKTARRWSSSMFTTRTGITVQAKGTGASLRGVRVGPHRPDLIICDDLEKDEHVATSEGRAKLEHWVRRVVMPALAPDGQLLVLGSIIHHDSLLAGLADRKRWPRWDYRVYRALEAERRSDGNYYRVALWPGRWSVERLDQERERIGTLAFEQEYQANPIDDSLRVFRPEWLRRFEDHEIADRDWPHIMAVDPATGATGGDYFALWVGAVDPATTTIYTRELVLERIGIVKQVRRILAAFEKWQPMRIGIETVAYQVALKEILEEESRKRGLYMPIVALKAAVNKRTRIEGSSVLFENGLFRLPASLCAEAEKQFLEYPKSRHDDAPDVCAMGIELARSLRALQKVEGITRYEQNGRGEGW
ncbi:MAG: hypothetical protein AB7N71_14800 [Phycisphaerae bacterium]